MNLDGIVGSHLLGFMAAIGVLRLLDDAAIRERAPRPTLSFDTLYRARLGSCPSDRGRLLDSILAELEERRSFYERALGNVKCPGDFSRARLDETLRVTMGWQRDALAGLVCSTGDEGIHESTLCAANGSGHQFLIQAMRDLLALVEREHLERALFEAGRADDTVSGERREALGLKSRKPTLRLDPSDERLYALRATNPTAKDAEYTTELGANALAIAAFELLPVCPRRRPTCIATRIHREQRGREFFQWVLWSPPARLPTVRSLLASGLAGSHAMRERGAIAAFSVARVTGDKGKLSMAPSSGIW